MTGNLTVNQIILLLEFYRNGKINTNHSCYHMDLIRLKSLKLVKPIIENKSEKENIVLTKEGEDLVKRIKEQCVF